MIKLDQYQKLLKKYYKSQNKKAKKSKSNKRYLDNLFIRFFLSSLILLSIVLINSNFGYKFEFLTKQMNFTKIGIDLLSILNEEKYNEQLLTTSNDYEIHEYDGVKNIFKSEVTNTVKCLKSGIVTNIKKINNLYTITIQTYDNYFFEYNNLSSIDCYLYQYIEVDKIIGSSNEVNNRFEYYLKLYNTEGNYEY